MDMQSTVKDNMAYVRERNGKRPTVIHFHGLLNQKNFRDDHTATQSGLFFADFEKIINTAKNSSADTINGRGKDQSEKGNTGDQLCAESVDCCHPKRHRTSFTSFQLQRLQEEFDRDSYIVGMKRWRLSEELDVPEKQIKIWFQNKRTKMKKNCSN